MSGVDEFLDLPRLCGIIKNYKDKSVTITFHSVGDRDSVASALALSEYLADADIATPDFITRNARNMVSRLYYGKRIKKSIRNGGAVIVLDANTLNSLSNFKETILSSKSEILFIDHHIAPKSIPPNSSIFNSEEYNSTSSIIYDVLKCLNVNIGRKIALTLLYGIIADSAGLRNATPHTFMQMSELIPLSGKRYQDLVAESGKNIPENIRYLSILDIKTATVEEVGKYVLVYGKSASHPNSVAEMALNIGADIAVFWSVKENEASISSRMQPNLDKKLGIHLGAIMQRAGSELNGNGGGHPCAAGAYGPAKENINTAISRLINELKERMA